MRSEASCSYHSHPLAKFLLPIVFHSNSFSNEVVAPPTKPDLYDWLTLKDLCIILFTMPKSRVLSPAN